MAALNLFPYRVAFVDSEGKLTLEAYRALMALYGRAGGSFGDQGIDVFASTAQESDEKSTPIEMISQPASIGFDYPDMPQPPTAESLLHEMVFQPEVIGGAIQTVTPGASPYTYRTQLEGSLSVVGGTMSALSLTRAGASVSLATSTPMIPLSQGDAVTITYTVAPTLKFIPR